MTSIPILDGSNHGQWSLRMEIRLRSRDLLEVCEKGISEDATPSAINKWKKAYYNSIDIIPARINEKVSTEVLNEETGGNAYLLWLNITNNYASNHSVSRGRIWMELKQFFFYDNLQNSIGYCEK
ncbi:hypothetical protein O181_015031 [Austropuccinia psidii MF-1]|uniref:DUF4219 domain-containing protein n=1 Tax=Austropuccinia psidii MF-1 TaxID=1389203 RepID=A0A9Q3GPQ1_9BASI|nr:hypothetical protein [Austropuccinia psidii MF-1]